VAQRLTQKLISKLISPPSGNTIEYDSEIPGFGVRITAAGVVAFVLGYRIHGRERRYTIGRHPELTATAARERAIQLRGRILDGNDPLKERQDIRSAPTMDDLIDLYLDSDKEKKKRPHTIRDEKRMAEKIIRPKLAKLPLAAVERRDIEKLHASMKETPYQANRVLALLSAMFTYAMKDRQPPLIKVNPVVGIERYHEQKREAWLSIEQIQNFRAALDAYKDQNAADALRLLLLTGSRVSEVLKAEWEHFDLDHGVWTKPSHHVKQKKTEHVPLSVPALALLNRMRPARAKGPLFPGKEIPDSAARARVSLKRPWIQACKAAGLVEVVMVKGKRAELKRYRPTIRTHDLRHNFASHLVSNGVGLQVVGKLLGHTQASTTMRYSHLQDDALRSATNQLAKIIKFGSVKKAAKA
jgi:integrase